MSRRVEYFVYGRMSLVYSMKPQRQYYIYHTHTGVCEQNTPPDSNTIVKIGFQSAKSGAGEQCLLLDCMARAHIKGVFLHRHR